MVGHNESEGGQPRNSGISSLGQRLGILEASSIASVKASLRRRAGVEVHDRSFNGLSRNLGEPGRIGGSDPAESPQQAAKARRR
jgi:hypothetical protein